MAYAIIVAGGQGLRMGAAEPKQYLKLNSVPILVHTLRVFQAAEIFKSIVLVLPAKDIGLRIIEMNAYGDLEPIAYVPGGDTRQDSVFNALQAIQPLARADEIVCIHDAVRPLIDTAQITACLSAAVKHGAAILGVPVNETVKRCNEAGRILETVPRDGLWLARTPQAARFGLLWQAYSAAVAGGFNVTDDAALLEAQNIPVYVVRGSRTNIKITEPEDLHFAAQIMSLK